MHSWSSLSSAAWRKRRAVGSSSAMRILSTDMYPPLPPEPVCHRTSHLHSLETIIQIERRLGAAKYQVSVWLHQGPYLAEDRFLGFDVEIDQNVPHQHEVHLPDAYPRSDEVELTKLDH